MQNIVEIRHIVPPRLDDIYLGPKTVCYRPKCKSGVICMKIITKGDKVIAHNYGHAGAGWSLAPGCVDHVHRLLLQHSSAANLQVDTPIAVVGAGVIGLFSAYDLVQKGFKNITIYAEQFDNITSHNAGGLFMPARKIPLEIAKFSYEFYKSIAVGQHAHFQTGARILPLYCKSREGSGMESYVGVMMQEAKDVILDFGNGTQRRMVVYDDGIFIDIGAMMRNLPLYLQSVGVHFVQKQLESFDQLIEKYVIHATGLQAPTLQTEEKMVPVQGHLVMLKNQKQEDISYMISMNVAAIEMTPTGYFMRRCFYFIPKQLLVDGQECLGVIGATFIDHATDKTPHLEQFDKVIAYAQQFYGLS